LFGLKKEVIIIKQRSILFLDLMLPQKKKQRNNINQFLIPVLSPDVINEDTEKAVNS